jgi:alcohol dehydrogenase
MKAIQLTEPKQFRRIEIDEPAAPGPGEALVTTRCMGVCGTDLSGYLGKMPFFSYPRIIGHELGVEVLDVGAGVEQVQAGDRCSVEPYINQPDSHASRRGATNCCQQLKVLGVHTDGGLRSRWIVPARKLHPSTRLNFEQLALVETLAIGCHATDRGAPQPGEHCLIIGAGPIGLATLEFTRLTGAIITVMDMNEQRLEFCKSKYGVAHTIVFKGDGSELEQMREITGGELYRLVTDATGSPKSMSHALNYVAHTGTMVYVGITTDIVQFPHPLLHAREMTIKGSRNALPGDFRRIVGLIEDGTIDTVPWITHRVEFDEMIGVFDSFTRPETGVIKAVVRVE